jgi:hypothetical protein
MFMAASVPGGVDRRLSGLADYWGLAPSLSGLAQLLAAAGNEAGGVLDFSA